MKKAKRREIKKNIHTYWNDPPPESQETNSSLGGVSDVVQYALNADCHPIRPSVSWSTSLIFNPCFRNILELRKCSPFVAFLNTAVAIPDVSWTSNSLDIFKYFSMVFSDLFKMLLLNVLPSEDVDISHLNKTLVWSSYRTLMTFEDWASTIATQHFVAPEPTSNAERMT